MINQLSMALLLDIFNRMENSEIIQAFRLFDQCVDMISTNNSQLLAKSDIVEKSECSEFELQFLTQEITKLMAIIDKQKQKNRHS